MILVVPPFTALLVTLSPTRSAARPGGPITTRELLRGRGPPTASTLPAQVFGTAVLLGITLVPGDIALRVGLAYAVGSTAAAAAMLL
ncbi:hypothetical protein ACWGAN_02575 [Streptomyces sp. NPDC054945]